MTGRFSCVIAGAGNIGSFSARLVARLPEVGRVVLVDFDRVERANLATQHVSDEDVGRPKVTVLAAKLRATRPELDVVAHVARIEDVPLGSLRADVLLGCLDSRAARMSLNEAAIALGVPLVDAGVAGSGLLARVSAFPPAGACLECAWDADAYAQAAAVFACDGSSAAPPATGAPAYLGAAAAALQAAACSELLPSRATGDEPGPADGSETILDLRRRTLTRSWIAPCAHCRMAPHRPWAIERSVLACADLSLRMAFDLGPPASATGARTLGCARGPFATRLRCRACSDDRPILRIASSLGRADRRCPRCESELAVGGFDLREQIDLDGVSTADLHRSLADLGLVPSDVITVRAGAAARHIELC